MSWFGAPTPKDSQSSPAQHPVGGLRGWRRLLILLALAVVVALFYAEEDWRGKAAWEKHRHQLAAQGTSLAPTDYLPPMVPDDENFAMTPFLAPLFSFLPGTQHWRDTNAMARVNGLAPQYNNAASLVGSAKGAAANSWVKARTDLVRWYAAFLQGTNRADAVTHLAPTQATVTEAARGVLTSLAEATPVLDELREASQRRYSRFNVRYEEDNPAAILLPHLAALKHICQVLQLRASAALALDQTDQAWKDVNLLLHLTDATQTEPMVISHLVRRGELQMALQPLAEGLADHRWSEPQLRQLEERLAQINFCADIKRALAGERALMGGPVIENMRRSPANYRLYADLGEAAGGSASGFDVRGLFWAAMPSGWFYFEQVNYSRTFQEFLLPAIDASNRVIRPEQAAHASSTVTSLLNNTPTRLLLQHRLFSAMLLPSLSGLFQKTAFAQSGVDTAVIACALERYRLDRGQFPEALEMLVPQFINSLPHDVVNGQALKYRRTAPERYVLYSVGWNQTDDGGTIATGKKGEGSPLNEGDWVWRLDL